MGDGRASTCLKKFKKKPIKTYIRVVSLRQRLGVTKYETVLTNTYVSLKVTEELHIFQTSNIKK